MEADESIRPEGCGIAIGDGESWVEVGRAERLWCGFHKCVYELKVWARESSV